MENVIAGTSFGISELVLQSGPVGKAVLVILFLFSILSWAIILQKMMVYKNSRNEDRKFLEKFAASQNLTQVYRYAQELSYSPVARVFLTGYRELYYFQEMTKKAKVDKGQAVVPGVPTVTPLDIKGIGLAMNKAINREIESLSNRLEFLATTGSASPFIGLFGTVWGIMHSFRTIGVKGTASIGGVAPGIAEALIATAAGLVAAIPAVIFFNYLNDKIRLFTSSMDDFSHDFLYLTEKNWSVSPQEMANPDSTR
ncbi:MAG: protein TolQ [Candidatus Nitrohelix vancouverensis]|uniref:Protein TolQ n=1 Tax=Candidatus Nitrohelix vancouverensis TaxID=2705534 RepID=A0A7T0BZU0_9BACT|nr:MAG: protein TolQ [Candidatus Nitrohelix vancouverensis]